MRPQDVRPHLPARRELFVGAAAGVARGPLSELPLLAEGEQVGLLAHQRRHALAAAALELVEGQLSGAPGMEDEAREAPKK